MVAGRPSRRNGLAHDLPVAAEAAPPQTIRKQRDGRRVGPVLIAREVAARDRLDAERGQEIRLHLRACQAHRVRAGQVAIVDAGPGGERRERLLPRAPFQVICAQHELLRDDGRHEAHRHQAVGLRVGKAAKQDAVHHAEHGRAGADAHRDGEHGGDRKCGRSHKAARGVAQILRQNIQDDGGWSF